MRHALAVSLVLLLLGCSSPALSADSPAFTGLDPAVVREVLDNPAAQARAEGDDPRAAEERYQGMARNFTLCRDALAAYNQWLDTGTPPTLAEQPEPANPASTAEDTDGDIERIKSLLTGGEISLLYDELTAESGCGDWIPAQPNDVEGPTVADAVRGLS